MPKLAQNVGPAISGEVNPMAELVSMANMNFSVLENINTASLADMTPSVDVSLASPGGVGHVNFAGMGSTRAKSSSSEHVKNRNPPNIPAQGNKRPSFMEPLPSKKPNAIGQILDIFKDTNKSIVEDHAETQRQIRQTLEYERKTKGIMDRTQAEVHNLNIRLEDTENTSGKLVWKITDMRRRRQAEREGAVPFILSPCFNSHRYGYKMQIKAYLNGDGVGLGKHLSIFLTILKGHYDDILPWPFTQKVTFMVMDQTGQGKDIQGAFRPDGTTSSFQKPVSYANVSMGCPQFMSLEVFKDEK